MTTMNFNESSARHCPLSEDELNSVVGGDTKAARPTSKPTSGKVFEIEDYSFDIEQVLH